jgi:hypothetical protein
LGSEIQTSDTKSIRLNVHIKYGLNMHKNNNQHSKVRCVDKIPPELMQAPGCHNEGNKYWLTYKKFRQVGSDRCRKGVSRSASTITAASPMSVTTASDVRPNVLLFGAGSVGAVYLWLLSRVADTTAVCRSNYDVVSKDGFIINSSIFGQDIHFKPRVVRNCEEAVSVAAGAIYDYIVVCSKAIPGIVPKLIAPAVTPKKTAIVLIQNGVGCVN